MVETKFLAVIVIAVIVFSVWFFFVVRLDRTSYEVVGKGIEGFTEAGTCSLATFNNECSALQTSEACLSHDPIGKCKVCVGEVNGAKITTCTLSICGCGSFYSDLTVEIDFVGAKKAYKAGETMEVKGVISTKLNIEKTDLQVRLSFLDSGKNPITRLGPGGVATATDKDGNFEWTYKIPEAAYYTEEPNPRGPRPGSVQGEYYLLASFGGTARDVEYFVVD